jgi:hypothetical protein
MPVRDLPMAGNSDTVRVFVSAFILLQPILLNARKISVERALDPLGGSNHPTDERFHRGAVRDILRRDAGASRRHRGSGEGGEAGRPSDLLSMNNLHDKIVFRPTWIHRHDDHPCFEHFAMKNCHDFITGCRQFALADLKLSIPCTGLSPDMD